MKIEELRSEWQQKINAHSLVSDPNTSDCMKSNQIYKVVLLVGPSAQKETDYAKAMSVVSDYPDFRVKAAVYFDNGYSSNEILLEDGKNLDKITYQDNISSRTKFSLGDDGF